MDIQLKMERCSICGIVIVAVFVYLLMKTIYWLLYKIPPLPKLDEKYWWGVGEHPKEEDTSINLFKISVPKEVLEDLNQRLHQARPFTPPLQKAQQRYGISTNLLKEIVEYWKTDYNWEKRELHLNQFPQYTTNIQGLDIHFLHVKPETSDFKVLPLLLLHGWPGSVVEFYESIPLLTVPQKGWNFVFEVIVPSLPGYGFSQGTTKRGLGAAEVAVIFKNLMERLGFEKYYLQGGDWGAVIVTHMATLFPKHVSGVHVNMTAVNTPLSRVKLVIGQLFPRLVIDKKNEKRVYPLWKLFYFFIVELGYMHLQATKPDTVGVALNDSPVGLAAYILEKFTTWTNQDWKKREDGGLKLKFTYTKLLDNIMIYWITNSITTSMRLYAESLSIAQMRLKLDRIPARVPSACARFANDPFYQPDAILKEKYRKLLQSSDIPVGGHFAALEEPQLFADNVWSAVEKFERYHKRIQTKHYQ